MRRHDDAYEIQESQLSSPFGSIRLAASRRGAVAIALNESEEDFREYLLARHAPARLIGGRDWLAPLEDWLAAYLAGKAPDPLRVPRDPAGSPFQRRVWDELARLPWGELLTYGALARRVACTSPRAVGQAMGRNPLPVLVPCHRVLAATGGLGGYSGGLDLKRLLLAFEGFRVNGDSGRVERDDGCPGH